MPYEPTLQPCGGAACSGEQGVGGYTSEGATLWWSVPAAPTRSVTAVLWLMRLSLAEA